MKKGDFIWGGLFIAICIFLLTPITQAMFKQWTMEMPYVMGFIKFAILATMGEMLAIRIVSGDYNKPAGLIWRIIIWGFIGILVTLMFNVFAGGVRFSLDKGFLPFKDSQFSFAFFTSLLMNCFFAPPFMAFHKYTDTNLDLRAKHGRAVSLSEITAAIDWDAFVSFVVLKTIPFFWIPAHTITFLLPPEYRVLVAAFLSIALGMILSFAKKSKTA